MNIIIILYFIDMYSIKDNTIEFADEYNEVVDIQKNTETYLFPISI